MSRLEFENGRKLSKQDRLNDGAVRGERQLEDARPCGPPVLFPLNHVKDVHDSVFADRYDQAVGIRGASKLELAAVDFLILAAKSDNLTQEMPLET